MVRVTETIGDRMLIKTLLVCLVISGALSHHLRHRNGAGDLKALPEAGVTAKSRRSLQEADRDKMPYSFRKLDKMMRKAILQIILGDLHPSDMLLLKALNYTMDDVMTMREHELRRIKDEEEFEARAKKQQELVSAKYQAAMRRRSSLHQRRKTSHESSLEAYNRQAVYDYESGTPATSAARQDYEEARVADPRDKSVTEETLRRNFDRAMEKHVVFKIRHDDSEFDSGSDERSRLMLKSHRAKTIARADKGSRSGATGAFQASGLNNERAAAATAAAATLDEADGSTRSSYLEDLNMQAIVDYENLVPSGKSAEADDKREREFASHEEFERALNGSRLEDMGQRNEFATTEKTRRGGEDETTTTPSAAAAATAKKRVSEYEGLEWVEGDVYRVIPEAMETLVNYEDEAGAPAAAPAAANYDKREGEEENLRQTSYSSLGDIVNDTFEYQNDADESALMYATNGSSADNQNLTSYQRFAMAQRRE